MKTRNPKRVRLRDKRPGISILDAIADQHLFAPWFRERDSWSAWMAFLAALFGLPMSRVERDIYRQCTGRDDLPDGVPRECWLVIGRRGGKSFILALIAVFIACFRENHSYLAPGERGTVMIIAADRKQARVILRYIGGLLHNIPMLARMIDSETRESFDLNNSISIEINTASFRSTRGYTVVAALCDEIAFWSTDNSTEPDHEILNALRPAMSTVPGAMLLCASSPYARRGSMWDAHKKYYGKDGPVLVWQAPTRRMNPGVPQNVIDEATERDPASAAAEYGAEFRTDVEALLTRESIEACISPSVYERPFLSDLNYVAFVDPSGGSADSFTLAIAHREGQGIVLDAVRERKPPFSPEEVAAEYSVLLQSYRIYSVIGDRYGGEFPRELFRRHGVQYEPSTRPKSDLYRDFLPLLNSRRADLLDHGKMINQLVGLERRTARGGRDSIDHAPGGHDDIANAVAGVCVCAANYAGTYDETLSWVDDDERPSSAVTMISQLVMRGGF